MALLPTTAVQGQADNEAQAEQKVVLREIISLAEKCAGVARCFEMGVRPFGPLHVYAERQIEPEFAKSITNFAFGAAAGGAKADYQAVRQAFFCGEECMFARRDTMLRKLPALKIATRSFVEKRYERIALWPDGAVLADDLLIKDGKACRLGRTTTLGLTRNRLFDPEKAISVPMDVTQAISTIAAGMAEAGVTALVKDETGGVRAIHADSYIFNEAGLLFMSDDQAAHLNRGMLLDGAQYKAMSRVASGVFFYLKA
jgi:hypothetical protein